MTRLAFPLCLAIGAFGLAACNATDGDGMAPTPAAATAPPSSFGLPPGAPCSGEIGRYDAVVKDDLRTGNVDQKVYDQIQRELARATAACGAGKGSEAHALVAASKSRHGYRA